MIESRREELRTKAITLRDTQDMTNQHVSDRSGIPYNTVINLFSTKSKEPSVYTVGPVCKVLGLSLDEFFGIDPFVDQRAADQLESQKRLIEALQFQNDELLEREGYLRKTADERSKRIDQLGKEVSRIRAGFWGVVVLLCAVTAAFVFSLIF